MLHPAVSLRLRLLLLSLLMSFSSLVFAMPTLGLGPFNVKLDDGTFPVFPGTLDGSAPFDVLGNCADTRDMATQGEDCGGGNGVVRSQDIVSHVWSVTADNYDPGAPTLKNVVLEQTITPSTHGVIDFERIPVACTPTGGGGSSPASKIVKNTDGSRVLTCNLGEFTEGQQKSITINVKVSGDSWNDSNYTSTQRVYSLDDSSNANATEGTSPAVGPIRRFLRLLRLIWCIRLPQRKVCISIILVTVT